MIKPDIFLIFAQNIDIRYTLELPQRGSKSAHNLCFRAKMCIPLNPFFKKIRGNNPNLGLVNVHTTFGQSLSIGYVGMTSLQVPRSGTKVNGSVFIAVF